ncbi:hypothetical protein G6F70_007900 [Rhizopus microsporus]|nr:hypothetical protein G6F71_008362 [Rhizopus microsporus]KAG1195867.1 hypothetical protein G6F70_007900 [Rhizopus microsporus]KAG1207064.1 hypothetical protein G6F69_008348 [Rhizopus microsporus]KAG1228367.1 hypothetical protein G6F67_007865 [Rhizopus microsporus]KAG1262393.1 hypothetical protein G6F68_005976 [Rhizopus microsporus]
MSSDEDACDICEGDKSSKKNPIIFCDGDVCYRVDEVPEDDWFCQSCENKKNKKPANIICCPQETGAARRTITFGELMHVVCAMWNKDIDNNIEPYAFNKQLLNQETCFLCEKSKGLCITCEEPDCKTTFHVTCAINNGLITPAASVSSNYSPKCSKHQPNFPSKKHAIRRRLRPGTLREPSTSDEEEDSDRTAEDEEDEDKHKMQIDRSPIRKEPHKKEIPAKRPSDNLQLSRSDEDDDDMGTSKKSKFGGTSYREMLEAKRKKSAFETKSPFGLDIKRPSITTPPLPQPSSQPPPQSTTIMGSNNKATNNGATLPFNKPKLALGAHRLSLTPPLKKANGPNSPMEENNNRPTGQTPRWGNSSAQTTPLHQPQPTTPSIVNTPFFDIDTLQKKAASESQLKGEKEEIARLREEFRKLLIEKEDTMRTLTRVTEDYNRLREEKKKWMLFKQNLSEVFAALKVPSPINPTPDTIEQYVNHIYSLIKRFGPITEEERVLIEEASKSIHTKMK